MIMYSMAANGNRLQVFTDDVSPARILKAKSVT